MREWIPDLVGRKERRQRGSGCESYRYERCTLLPFSFRQRVSLPLTFAVLFWSTRHCLRKLSLI